MYILAYFNMDNKYTLKIYLTYIIIPSIVQLNETMVVHKLILMSVLLFPHIFIIMNRSVTDEFHLFP